jgi:hypothetical protein
MNYVPNGWLLLFHVNWTLCSNSSRTEYCTCLMESLALLKQPLQYWFTVYQTVSCFNSIYVVFRLGTIEVVKERLFDDNCGSCLSTNNYRILTLAIKYFVNNSGSFLTSWPPLWSSGQSSWLQIRRPGSIPGTTRKKSSGPGTGSIQPREYNWGATW